MLNLTSVLSLRSSAATVTHCFSGNNGGVSSLFDVYPKCGASLHSVGFCASNLRGRTGFHVCALKKRGKGRTGVTEMNDSDDDYGEEEDNIFDDYGDDDDGDADEMPLSFQNMKKWMENKPRGFGEGKVYDTSIEDELLVEIEQTGAAQAANLSNLKDGPASQTTKQSSLKKVPDVVVNGIRVRVINLPKKKKIHRDLKLAFDGVPGIINIIPAVAGNKKTRDPVCKGFAFVDFKSHGDATRFLQAFSSRRLTFGKIEKQIKCEMLNSVSSDSDQKHSADQTNAVPQVVIPMVEIDQYTDSDVVDDDGDDSSLEHLEENSNDEEEEVEEENIYIAEFEDIRETLDSKSEPPSVNLSEEDRTESRMETETESISPKELERSGSLERIRALEKKLLGKEKGEKMSGERRLARENKKKPSKKKVVVKGNEEKTGKLDIPGSAKRLKIKEKALLTDVISRYGHQAAQNKAKK